MALRFDASGDYLERTTSLPSESAVTMMGWFLMSVDRNDFITLMRLAENAGGQNMLVGFNSDGTTLMVYNSVTSDTGTNLSLDTWYHIALVGDTTNITGYLNGVLDCQVATPSLTQTRIQIGNASEFGEFFNGRAAAIKIYDAALTADEILLESRQYVPFRFADLNGWYPAGDNSVTDSAKDYSGNGRDFTANGTLAVEDGPPIPWRVESQVAVTMAFDEPAPGGYILLENGTDRILLEDGSGLLILEETEVGETVTSDVTTTAATSRTEDEDVTTTAAVTRTEDEDVTTTAAVSQTGTSDVTTSAALSTTNSSDVTTDAATSRTEDEDVTTTAAVSRTEDEDVTTTAAVSRTEDEDVTTDASIEITGVASADVTTDAATTRAEDENVTTDAAISQSAQSDVTTSGAISRTEDEDVTTDAAISRSEQSEVTTGAAVSRSEDEEVATSGAITRTEDEDVTTDAATARAEQSNVTTDATISVQGQVLFDLPTSAAIGPPATLLIDDRTLSASWIDDRTISASWVDARSLQASWSDNRIL